MSKKNTLEAKAQRRALKQVDQGTYPSYWVSLKSLGENPRNKLVAHTVAERLVKDQHMQYHTIGAVSYLTKQLEILGLSVTAEFSTPAKWVLNA